MGNRNSSQVIRYDTQKEFKNRTSYSTYDVGHVGGLGASCFDGGAFDGRHVYFIPLQDSVMVRCDPQGDFQDAGIGRLSTLYRPAWACASARSDGQYLYFVPYTNAVVVRYDTTRDYVDLAGSLMTPIIHKDCEQTGTTVDSSTSGTCTLSPSFTR